MTIDPAGVVNGNSATLEVAGDWDNAGTFNAGTSTVALVDGCGLASAVVAGDTTFANLEMMTTTGFLYSFMAGSTTSGNTLGWLVPLVPALGALGLALLALSVLRSGRRALARLSTSAPGASTSATRTSPSGERSRPGRAASRRRATSALTPPAS